jgi:D-ribose pyranose/furanose isomerase RbsD
MTLGWPAAFLLTAVVLGVVSLIATRMAAKAAIDAEEAKGKNGEQYKMLSKDYENLAKETRDMQATMQADIAHMRTTVDSIEQMMREV